QAAAAVNSAYANLKNIEVQLGNTTIKSPIEGILTTQTINPGQVVPANTTLLTLVDTSSLRFKTTISQDSVNQLTPGQALSIYVDSYPGRTFAGTVSSVGPIAVSTGEVFPVEITVSNDSSLMAGMSARSTLIIKSQGVAVPLAAVQQENGQNFVFVADDAQVKRRLVRTGFGNDTEIIVLEGLSEGEEVVTTSLNILADGMQVKIQ
ncbi:MAG: efflux RND transporter periplasmic adaptor subunit, partial [Syntrophomonadaceae bacterium]|nr:efflux RND transporter periplasmic adaptor subunit [Syntrophomonadaceae bacterium]